MSDQEKINRTDLELLALTVLLTRVALEVESKTFVNEHKSITVLMPKETARPLFQLLEDLIEQRKAMGPVLDDPSMAKAEFLVQAGLHGGSHPEIFARACADTDVASVIQRVLALAKDHLKDQRPSPKIGFKASPDVPSN